MCGIIGYTGKDTAVPYLIKGLKHLEYRGYDSAGVALCEGESVITVKTKGRVENLEKKLEKFSSEAVCGIGHTRWATHGEPSDVNSHPHSSMRGVFTVVHNGIIENYADLKKQLLSEGFTFESETDTEVVANILERYYEGDVKSAIDTCRSMLRGSYALCVLCRDFPGRIFAFRKNSPLVCACSESGVFFASDIIALMPYTEKVCTLKEYETAVADKNMVRIFGTDGKERPYSEKPVAFRTDEAEKGDFPHFMLKEIFQQPQVIADTVDTLTGNSELLGQISELKKSFFTLEKICFIGCGSAYNAALAGELITKRLCNITCSAHMAGEFRYGFEPLDGRTLCVFISQSGETADTLAALKKAKEAKAKILSVVNVPGSSMAQESEYVLYTRAGTEVAVATTKAYTAQLVTLYIFAVCIAHERWQMKRVQRKRLIKEIKLLSEKTGEIISQRDILEEMAHFFDGCDSGYFIGRGNDYAAAEEGSLKMKEISYINTQAYPAGELKHGTISLIEKGTPVIALCCEDRLFPKLYANIKEVKARGARVMIFASEKRREELSGEGDVFFLPDAPDEISCLLQVVALQLLSYYTAKLRGCDIDKPRNLAKSVTVE